MDQEDLALLYEDLFNNYNPEDLPVDEYIE
jgi:hypothetical protein